MSSYCLRHNQYNRPDDRRSKRLRNVCKLLQDYTAQHPWIQTFSYYRIGHYDLSNLVFTTHSTFKCHSTLVFLWGTQTSWQCLLNFPLLLLVSVKLCFLGWAASNVECYPTFRQALQLPSSAWICNGWALLKAYVGQAIGDDLDVVVLSEGTGCCPNANGHVVDEDGSSSSPVTTITSNLPPTACLI